MKIKCIVFFLLIASLTGFKAQEYLFHKLGTIKTDNVVKGYYFLISEEKSRKVKEFTLEIYNLDLVSTAKVTFTVHPDFVVKKNMPMTHPSMVQFLQNISFVDNFLMLQVYKMKEFEVFESKIFIIDILKNSILTTLDLSKVEANNYNYFLGGNGRILRTSGLELQAVDYSNKVLWTLTLRNDEYKNISFFKNGKNAVSKFNSDLVTVWVYKSGGKDKGYFEDMRLVDVNTGKEVFKFDRQVGEAINYSPEFIQQVEDGNYVVGGHFQELVEKGKEPNRGLFFQKLTKEGKLLISKKYDRSNYSNMFTAFKGVLYNDNKMILICGRKNYDFVSMRFKNEAPVFDNDAAADIVANGLCGFVLDKNLEFVEWNTFNSRKNIPEYKSGDYKLVEYFFEEPVINKEDNTTVLNAVVMKGKNFKENTKFVSVKLSNYKIIGTDEIEVNQDASWVDFIDAKPGYILIAEYYKKEKRLDKRLEKLSYQ